MVDAQQNLNGSRDLTMSLSGMICHSWLAPTMTNLSTNLPKKKSLSPPTTKIWKVI